MSESWHCSRRVRRSLLVAAPLAPLLWGAAPAGAAPGASGAPAGDMPALSPVMASTASGALQTIAFGGTLPDLKTVEIDNGHVYDYTFATAPTDWWVQSGVWEMTNRWNCSPGWSWFGGRSEEVAAVWNKRRFAGDISVQFYFAFKMGLAGTTRWTYHPADVAVTFCGDGKNLGSGYSLVVGADDNQHSVLMRGGKVVAETRDKAALLPVLSDGMPPNMNDLHRRWWYVRINKVGSRVECWLDNELILTYDDPQPLDIGQIALWTYNNGIMLSRVQVYYQDELRPGYRKVAAPSLKTTPATPTQQRAPLAVAQR